MNKAAFLVIDFINDLINPESKIATCSQFMREHLVIKNTNEVIRAARTRPVPVIFVKLGFSPNYIECNASSPLFGKTKAHGALQLNSHGTDFHPALDVQDQDIIIVKHRVSVFYATNLEAILRAHQITTLFLSGLATNLAIYSTALEAHDRDYEVVVIKDACAAASEEFHAQTLKTLERIAQIVTAKEAQALIGS